MKARDCRILLGIAAVALMTAPAFADHDAASDGSTQVATPPLDTPFGSGIVDFESLGLPIGTLVTLGDGVPNTVDGYTFTPGPNNASGLNDSHFGNAVAFWGYNGTHVAAFHDDVVMTKATGGTFDLVSFDLSGFPVGYEVPFTVTGQPGGVVANFVPDGVVDGAGGATDFETFFLPASFRDLTSVTWEHFGPATLQGIFSLDNINTVAPVSVDEKSWGEVKGEYR